MDSDMAQKKEEPPMDVAAMSALIEAQKKQIARLEKDLKYSQDKNVALNVLIDIAEEQGIKIRKNLGPSGRAPERLPRLYRRVQLRPAWPKQTGVL
jgi:hypothetical protein